MVFKIELYMKGTNLGEFQEIVLLIILVLDDNAYGVSIREEIKKRMDRKISRGALHAALSRLEDKGYIQSSQGEATPVRGGRRKKYYTLTKYGVKALEKARELREQLWQEGHTAWQKLAFKK